MRLLPGLYLRFVPVSLAVIAIIAQGLQVSPVEETDFPADRPGLNVIDTGSWAQPALALTFFAKRVFSTEGPGKLCPAPGVVRCARLLAGALR